MPNRTFVYDPRGNSWSEIPAPSGSTWPSIFNETMGYDVANDVFVFKGGNWTGARWYLFRYDPGTPPPNQPPIVALTAPSVGSTFNEPATISLAAVASDPDGTVARVDFYSDTTLLGSDTSAPYAFTWTNVPAGTSTLTARAVDNQGATTTSAPVSVTVSVAASPSTGQGPVGGRHGHCGALGLEAAVLMVSASLLRALRGRKVRLPRAR